MALFECSVADVDRPGWDCAAGAVGAWAGAADWGAFCAKAPLAATSAVTKQLTDNSLIWKPSTLTESDTKTRVR